MSEIIRHFAAAPDELARAILASVELGPLPAPLHGKPEGDAARAALPALVAEHGVGFLVAARMRGSELASPLDVVEQRTDGTVRARLRAVAARSGVPLAFPPEVLRETEALLAAPGIDDPSLVDLTALPFVTIDGPTSRDLDQALFLSRDGDGYCFRYAIADAAHYIKPGSALFEECLARGASYYLPGQSFPMLPRALSEGIISLNEGVDRRALVFHVYLNAAGGVRRVDIVRARVRSAAKLSFPAVQAFLDKGGAYATAPYAESLRLLPVVGKLREDDAALRQVVRYRRTELSVTIGGEGLAFVVLEGIRHEVERWNEHLSLLCNASGGTFLRDGERAEIQPIYRVHPAPDPDRIAALEAMIAAVVELHGLPPSFLWRAGGAQGLSDYIAQLPMEGPHARIAAAIQRQAILVNVRSSYSTEPGLHHGVGVEPYARFSAPMREIVGVFVHKEAIEKLEGRGTVDHALRARVVASANRARDVQRRLNDAANRMVLDQIFAEDLRRTNVKERPLHQGTVVGIAPGKVHVLLDAPTIDVKLYMGDVGKGLGGFLVVGHAGAALLKDGKRAMALGDAIRVRVEGRDEARDRWVLVPR